MAYKLEKIDQTHAKKIEMLEAVSVIDIESLRRRGKEIEAEIDRKNQEHEQEVARLKNELAQINEVLSEFEKLP